MNTVTEVGTRHWCASSLRRAGGPQGQLLPAESTVPGLATRSRRARTPSPRALSAAERQVVLDTLQGQRFQDRSPGHVVAALPTRREDTWLCSERTMYRLLKTQGGTKERRRQREHPVLRETPVAGLRAQSGLDAGFHEGERARPRHTGFTNAYSESHFKTTKYHPDYPGAFDGFEPAWAYFETFFAWYNSDHRHSGIAWLTPELVHTGQATHMLDRHQVAKELAFAANPERFVNGRPHVTPLPEEVWINGPPADEKTEVLRH